MQAWRQAGVAAVRDLGHKPQHATPRDDGGPPLLRTACVGLGATGEAAYWLGHAAKGSPGLCPGRQRAGPSRRGGDQAFRLGPVGF